MGLGQLLWEAYQGYLFICVVLLFAHFLYNNTGVGLSFLVICMLPVYIHLAFQHSLGPIWAPIIEEMATANSDMFLGLVNRTQTFGCVMRSIATNMQNLPECI